MKKIVVMFLIGGMMITSAGSIYATTSLETIDKSSDSQSVETYINKTEKVSLEVDVWKNVTSDNNILNASLRVVNHSNSPGTAFIRIVNGDGETISGPNVVQNGSTTTFKIGSFSGRYRIQAKAANIPGLYTFVIKD